MPVILVAIAFWTGPSITLAFGKQSEPIFRAPTAIKVKGRRKTEI